MVSPTFDRYILSEALILRPAQDERESRRAQDERVSNRMILRSAAVWSAIGLLVVAGPAAAGQDRSARVTFTQHIAPILLANCSSCHRPGGSAPFSLTTYADVTSHAREIVDATRRR